MRRIKRVLHGFVSQFHRPFFPAVLLGMMAGTAGPAFWVSARVIVCPGETWFTHVPLFMYMSGPALPVGAVATLLSTMLLRGLLILALGDRIGPLWRARVAAIVALCSAAVITLFSIVISVIVFFADCM